MVTEHPTLCGSEQSISSAQHVAIYSLANRFPRDLGMLDVRCLSGMPKSHTDDLHPVRGKQPLACPCMRTS